MERLALKGPESPSTEEDQECVSRTLMKECGCYPKNCHGCGLEAIDECPTKHLPSIPTFYPCVWCTRNPDNINRPNKHKRDHYSEAWYLDSHGLAVLNNTGGDRTGSKG